MTRRSNEDKRPLEQPAEGALLAGLEQNESRVRVFNGHEDQMRTAEVSRMQF